jgi:3'-phosphoadenosine 5'-phosphosulfate sulfotransferase (PAPS reductase)/FAD synthetase
MPKMPDLSIVERHAKPVLQFSGGKDSLSCLWLLEKHWPRLTVAWVNTGDAFPETVKLMKRVRALPIKDFIEVRSDVRAQQAQWGYPVDLLPVRSHASVMAAMLPHPRQKLQSFVACCSENLWEPLAKAMKRIGATLIIRGTRAAEPEHSPIRSGDVVDGIEYFFPLFDWSAEDVYRYLADKLPESYAFSDRSLDCMHCTAYLFESAGNMRYLAKHHAREHAEVTRRLEVIAGEVEQERAHLHAALEACGRPQPEPMHVEIVKFTEKASA